MCFMIDSPSWEGKDARPWLDAVEREIRLIRETAPQPRKAEQPPTADKRSE